MLPVDAEEFIEIRKQRGMTQKDVATQAGIGQASISRFESGEHGVDCESYFKMLRAVGISCFVSLDPEWRDSRGSGFIRGKKRTV